MYEHIARLKQSAELLHRKIINFLAGGVLRYSKIKKGMQLVQMSLLSDEVKTDMQHPQEYGFTSKAKSGAFGVAAFKGGNRDNGMALIIYDRRYLPSDLADGDACHYDFAGNRIWLKGADGILIKNGNNSIVLNNQGITFNTEPGTPIIMNAPLVVNGGITTQGGAGNCTIQGNITATGNVSDTKGSMEEMRATYNAHTHNSPGGTTNTPNQPMD